MPKYICKNFHIGIFYFSFYKLRNKWAFVFEIHTKGWQ